MSAQRRLKYQPGKSGTFSIAYEGDGTDVPTPGTVLGITTRNGKVNNVRILGENKRWENRDGCVFCGEHSTVALLAYEDVDAAKLQAAGTKIIKQADADPEYQAYLAWKASQQAAPAATTPATTTKRQRSAKQLANDERLRNEAAARRAGK